MEVRSFEEPASGSKVMMAAVPIAAIALRYFGIEANGDNVHLFQGVLLLEATIITSMVFFAVQKFKKLKAEAKEERIVCVKLPGLGPAKTGDTEEEEDLSAQKQNVYDYDIAAMYKLLLVVGMGLFVSFVLPWKWEVYQPASLQVALMPLSFFQSRLVQATFFGKQSTLGTWETSTEIESNEDKDTKKEK